MHFNIHTDGGARGNPGPAAAGVVIESNNHSIKLKKFLGTKTNNQAEYLALILALEYILKVYQADSSIITAVCYLDSELVAKQLNGNYKVKNAGIKPLFEQVKKICLKFHKISFVHISRDQNKEADQLVNRVLDEHINKRL